MDEIKQKGRTAIRTAGFEAHLDAGGGVDSGVILLG